jgi:hypothetical protein
MNATVVDQVVAALWPPGAAPGATVWTILDCARDERIYPALQSSRLEYISLYAGKLPDALKRAAPYLVELAAGYRFSRPLLEMGWGHSWGVFLRIKDPQNLRHHLRNFLRVQDEAGRRLVFRYYDPRVLRAYLPTCEPAELKTIFGPISSYVTEADHGRSLVEFTFDGRRLTQRRTDLTATSVVS